MAGGLSTEEPRPVLGRTGRALRAGARQAHEKWGQVRGGHDAGARRQGARGAGGSGTVQPGAELAQALDQWIQFEAGQTAALWASAEAEEESGWVVVDLRRAALRRAA